MHTSTKLVWLLLVLLVSQVFASSTAARSTEAAVDPDPETYYADVISGKLSGYIALARDDGSPEDQAVAYCVNGMINTLVILDYQGGGAFILDAKPGFTCQTTTFREIFPGAKMVVNKDPRDGWVTFADQAQHCDTHGYLVTVTTSGRSLAPSGKFAGGKGQVCSPK